jgi:GH25 family lysozyme M1 (1,4-beta-N-acetylmuramidase)
MTEIKGIDVSHYQNDRGAIDFGKVKASGYGFAVVKATEGSEAGSKYLDPYFKQNVEAANAAGLTSHAYHFFRGVSEADARAEAQWFLKNLHGIDVKGYLFVDVEYAKLTSDKGKLTSYVNEFLDELAKNGFTKLGIYSGKSFFESRLNEQDLRPGTLKWIARYNNVLGRDADIWQHSSKESVSGIIGAVDVNIAYTDAVLSTDSASNKESKPAAVKLVASKTLKPAKSKPKASVSVLKKGDRGAAVLTMQKKLASIFFYPDKGAKDNGCDGVYGPKTEDTVRRFQSTHGLTADGIYGPKTAAALEKAIAAQKKKPAAKKKAVHSVHVVEKGDTLWDIAQDKHTTVQQLMNLNHLNNDTIYPGQKIKY